MGFLESSSGSDASDSDRETKKRGSRSSGVQPGLSKRDSETLQVNEKFAKRFDKQKREQELQATKHLDLGSDEGSESDSETEDEDGEMLTPALDLQIMKTINKIRSKDPDIYNTTKEWFVEDDSGAKKGGAQDTKKADKRMRYKDVVREQILGAETAEDAISSEEDSDNDDDAGIGRRGGRTFAYDDEQENLRKGFLGSIAKHEGGEGGDESDGQESGDDGDGLLKVRRKTAAEEEEEEELLRKEAEKMASKGDGGEEDAFLRDFVANRRWLDPHAKETPSYEEILNAPHVEDSDDEKDIDQADNFESKYNFRFEEEGGGEIAMHSRNVAGSMRRKDDRRKRERESRKARKAEERQRKEAELRRLKNLKREEIRRRLQAIQEMSGGALVDGDMDGGPGEGAAATGDHEGAEALIEGDFDPEKWDAVTGKAFGDDYYEADDADDGWKPGDDPLEGLGDLDQYAENEADGNVGLEGNNQAVQQNHQAGEGDGDWEADEDWDGEEEWDGVEGEAGDIEDTDLGGVGAQKERLLDELYKLDYEDIIGDIPCRFKYTKVKANDFGLTSEEILLADDKDLNKYVPLKKLAPYRTDEPKLDARRRRRLRDEVKDREEAAEADMLALRAKKKRRGRKKKGVSSSSPAVVDADDGISAVLDSESGATPTTDTHGSGEIGDGSASIADGTTSATDPGETTELAGGKRRRRKKGQKKQRAQAGGVVVGNDADGQAEADLVPRVAPILPDQGTMDDAGEEARGSDVAGGDSSVDGTGKGRKRSKKRGRVPDGTDGGTVDVQQNDRNAGRHSGEPSGNISLDRAPITRAENGPPDQASAEESGRTIKKTRRGTSGKGRGASNDAGDEGGRRAKEKAKRGEGKVAAQLGAKGGVSKSRLASYGL